MDVIYEQHNADGTLRMRYLIGTHSRGWKRLKGSTANDDATPTTESLYIFDGAVPLLTTRPYRDDCWALDTAANNYVHGRITRTQLEQEITTYRLMPSDDDDDND